MTKYNLPRTVAQRLDDLERAVSTVQSSVTGPQDLVTKSDLRTPAPPQNLSIQTVPYADAGNTYGMVNATWDPVDSATEGYDLEISGYELWGAPQTTGEWRRLTASTDTTGQYQPFDAGSTWSFRVRAIARQGTAPGVWSNTVTTLIAVDTVAPPKPSLPTVTVNLATHLVRWDGKLEGNQPLPADFAHVELAAGPTSTPTTVFSVLLSGPVTTANGNAPYDVPVYYRMRSVDYSGNKSDWTDAVSATSTPLVLQDIEDLTDWLEENDKSLAGTKDAWNLAIENANTVRATTNSQILSALGKSSITYAASAPAGNSNLVWVNTSLNPDVAHTWNGTSWVASSNSTVVTALANAEAADQQVTDAKARYDEAVSSATISLEGAFNQITYSPLPPSGQGTAEGHTWFQRDGSGTVIAQWRWAVTGSDSAGTIYAWQGMSDNSPSTKTVNNVLTSTNLVPNPKPASTSGFVTIQTGDSLSILTESGKPFIRCTYASAGANRGLRTPLAAVVNNQPDSLYRSRVRVRSSVAGVGLTIRPDRWSSGSQASTETGVVITTTGDWQDVTDLVSDFTASGAINARLSIFRSSGAVGDTIDVEQIMTEKGTSSGAYFDGDTPDIPEGSIYGWVPVEVGSEVIANLDVGKLTASAAEINTLVAQRIAAASGQFIDLSAENFSANLITADFINVGSLAVSTAFITTVQAMGVVIVDESGSVVINLTGQGDVDTRGIFLTDASGKGSASMSAATGAIYGRTLETEEVNIDGIDLVGPYFPYGPGYDSDATISHLDVLPRGLVSYGLWTENAAYPAWDSDGYGWFEIEFEQMGGRRGEVEFSGFVRGSASGLIGTVALVYTYVDGAITDDLPRPSRPLVSSSVLAQGRVTTPNGSAAVDIHCRRFIALSNPSTKRRWRILAVVQNTSGSGTILGVANSSTARAYISYVDHGAVQENESAIANSGGGKTSSGSTPPSTPDPDPPKQRKTKTITASSHRTFLESGSEDSGSQGSANPITGDSPYTSGGSRRAQILFPSLGIPSGATMKKVEIYLYAEHWHLNSGGQAVVRYSGSTALRSSSDNSYLNGLNQVAAPNFGKPQGRWITLSSSVHADAKAGDMRSLFVHAPSYSNSSSYYGYFSNANDGSRAPKIRVTYEV